ncbi:hypothetical protein CDAR_92401 [Caerostris darwini]|uniref:Ubiquitin-like domain-containing protein n=1 Tax=Caerostris darwini TaxID=1538125 RepID=A0AAV4PCY5_9ARAC|nr:hypothetical protein CDAR_92401 [Caerostris darwini]
MSEAASCSTGSSGSVESVPSSSEIIVFDRVQLLVRRQKSSILLEVTEDTSVQEVKKVIEEVAGVKPEDQQLIYKEKIMKPDMKSLREFGIVYDKENFTYETIGLVFRDKASKRFKTLKMTPFSKSPVIPGYDPAVGLVGWSPKKIKIPEEI